MDHMVDAVVATADAVAARPRSTKKIMISFDEWNVWYQQNLGQCVPVEWTEAPRVSEEAYTVADAVVVGNLLISLLRHSDRVTAACQALLVNAVAPIRAEPTGAAWRQTTFHPFALTSRLARGHVLRVGVSAPTTDTAAFGDVPVLDAVATHPDTGDVTVFMTKRHLTEDADLQVQVRAFGDDLDVLETWRVHDDDPLAVNTQEAPDRVVPQPAPSAVVKDGVPHTQLPPVSWSALRLGGSS